MAKLDKLSLRKLILQEIQKMKEDALYHKHQQGHEYRAAQHTTKCIECGYMMREVESVCEQCGAMYEIAESLNEGDCGCGTCAGCSDTDYEVLNYDTDHNFIPDHMENHYDDDIMEPGEAFGLDVKIGNHGHYKGAYMAKKQMYKVSKYAEKIYHMIPDGHNLEDWMRTKLAQIADDIGEVYHALDHDVYEGDI